MNLTTKPFKNLAGVVESGPLPLENVPIHTQLARANKRHAQLTEQLRVLKADWAMQNAKAQACRQPIPTSQITHVETRRRELHLALEATQAEIGRLNRELKERKATPKASHRGNSHDSKPAVRKKKKMPFADDPTFPTYFHLAARESLAPSLYGEVERLANSLMHDAHKNGVES